MRFTFAGAFSTAFSSLRKGWLPLLIVTALLYVVPSQLVMLGLRYGLGINMMGGRWWETQYGMAVPGAAMLVMYFLSFMHISAAYEICVLSASNKPVKLGEVITHALGNAVPVFVIYLLCSIGWMLGLVLLIVPAFIFGTLFSIVVPAYIAEKPGIFGAFGRSRALTKGHRWGIFGLWLLVVVVFYFIVAAMEVPLLMPMIQQSMVAAQSGTEPVPPSIDPLLMAAFSVAFSAVWVVILALNAAVYICLRGEKEQHSAKGVEKVFE